MRVVRAFMALKLINVMWKKYLLKWLTKGTWVQVQCMLIVCYLIINFFDNMLNHEEW